MKEEEEAAAAAGRPKLVTGQYVDSIADDNH